MEVEWRRLSEFPNYSVSNVGEIVNEVTGRVLRQSCNRQGMAKVNLIVDGVSYTRSVRLLVAEAFVPGKTDIFDTPINQNGDPMDNAIDNLMWRPRWFAWKHARQFAEVSPHHHQGPIRDIETLSRYIDIYEAAVVHGLLFKDIWRSIHLGKATFPTGQVFDFIR